jgi:hypothetical protein
LAQPAGKDARAYPPRHRRRPGQRFRSGRRQNSWRTSARRCAPGTPGDRGPGLVAPDTGFRPATANQPSDDSHRIAREGGRVRVPGADAERGGPKYLIPDSPIYTRPSALGWARPGRRSAPVLTATRLCDPVPGRDRAWWRPAGLPSRRTRLRSCTSIPAGLCRGQ